MALFFCANNGSKKIETNKGSQTINLLKIMLIIIACLPLSGCFGCYNVTELLHRAGQQQLEIDKIERAYLSDGNKLILYGTKTINYRGAGSETVKMEIGIDLDKTKKNEIKSVGFYLSNGRYLPYIEGNTDSIRREQSINICNINLSQHVLFTAKSGKQEIQVLSDKQARALEYPFVLAKKNRGGAYVYKDKDCINVIQLSISDGYSQPSWSIIKYPLYPITLVIDTILLPYDILTFKPQGYH